MSLATVGMTEESEIDESVRLAESLAPLADDELGPLLDESKRLLAGDQPSDHSRIFWVYDAKTLAWEESSEPELVRY